MDNTIRCSVPGKVMLAGEYGVLFGGKALAVTLNKFLHLRLTTRNKTSPAPARSKTKRQVMTIFSEFAEGHTQTWRYEFDANANLTPLQRPENRSTDLVDHLVNKSQSYWSIWPDDISIKICSELDLKAGIGSSSALNLAWFAAWEALCRDNYVVSEEEKLKVLRKAFLSQIEFQKGKASGYDLITQMCGGLVSSKSFEASDLLPLESNFLIEKWPIDIERYPSRLLNEQISIWVQQGKEGGAATTATINSVLNTPRISEWRELGNHLCDAMVQHITNSNSPKNWADTYAHIRNLRTSFSLSSEHNFVENLALSSLKDLDQTWSFKLTGAGGRDAILIFGNDQSRKPAENYLSSRGWNRLDAQFGEVGLTLDCHN